jgi:hypothetical protein
MIQIDPGSLSGKAHCPQQYICEKKGRIVSHEHNQSFRSQSWLLLQVKFDEK